MTRRVVEWIEPVEPSGDPVDLPNGNIVCKSNLLRGTAGLNGKKAILVGIRATEFGGKRGESPVLPGLVAEVV